MEGVEIVMEVEEAFDIRILDAEAEKVRTPRHLIELIMGKVGRSDVAVCLTQRAFHRLRRAFMSELHLKRADFRLDVPTDQLLPPATRKTALDRICQHTGVIGPPHLVRPRWLVNSLFAVSLTAAIAIYVALSLAAATRSVGLNLIRECGCWVGLAGGGAALWIGFLLTKQKATEFPPRLRTVRGLARWLVANNPQLLGAPPGQWSREQVAEKVREIVVDHLGAKNYREDARFVEDLGLN
jgi:acyl carrier protein